MRICRWCGRRVRWPWRHCKRCRPYYGDAGLYQQSGGPPCSYMQDLPKAGER